MPMRLFLLGLAGLMGSLGGLLIFIASQLFWFRRVREVGEKFITDRRRREWLGAAAVILYLFLFAYNFVWSRLVGSPVRLTTRAALFEAPFAWWVMCSLLGFAIIILLSLGDRAARCGRWAFGKIVRPSQGPAAPVEGPEAVSVSRRQFLEKAAYTVSTAPFFAGAYGLLYGRLNLETSNRRIRLARLPRAFHGLRIAQLSDIHIGPFMTAEEIRRMVGITNAMKADVIVLTGDYVTWDAATEGAAVDALSGLRAPLGVFGTLGNHELWTGTEASITRLFAARGFRILRRERAAIEAAGETLNLIGVDYETRRRFGPPGLPITRQYLEGVEPLLRQGTANILLSHNPNTFDRAAELGIDLSLAGHTHGGQVTLEFIHPSLSPSRLITPYVSGWFEKSGAQLYVNRGIGTIGVPMRVGAPPEITLFELVRET